jgi:hypothetical protein
MLRSNRSSILLYLSLTENLLVEERNQVFFRQIRLLSVSFLKETPNNSLRHSGLHVLILFYNIKVLNGIAKKANEHAYTRRNS